MKKLMVAVVSAASAMLAFGDLPHGAGFEANAFTVGASFTTDKDDAGGADGTKYWSSSWSSTAAEEIGAISNGTANATSVPDMFSGASNAKYLHIDTSGKLYRNIAEGGAAVQMDTGDGIYLDTLVQFTAADQVFDENTFTNGDKIAIEYAETDNGITNFVVRAGVVGSDAANYLVNAPANFDVNAWHRLTVRTIADIAGNLPGFKIYVDEVALTYLTDNADFAQSSGITDDTHTIFPSAVKTDEVNYNTISAVAFTGNGSLDDVVFTSTTPNFIKASEAVVATFTADAGVTAITVTVGQTDYNVDMTAFTVSLPAGTTTFTVTATIDSANGYSLASLNGGNSNPATVSDYAGDTIAISTTRNNFTLFDENGDAISGTYATLAQAMAATGVAKIQLAYNYTETTIPDEGPVYTIADGKTLVLDLNGKTLDGGTSDENELFYVQGALTVIDSGNGGKIVYGGTYGMFDNTGDLAIGAADGDQGVTIDGVLFVTGDEGALIRANVKADVNTTDNKLTWTVDPGSACAATAVDGYWVVAPKVAEPFTVTVTPDQNATYAVTGNATKDGDVYTVAAGETITITATPAWNYEYATAPTGWTAGQDGAITIDVNVAGTVAIPAPTALEGWGFYLGRPVDGAYTIDDAADLNALKTGVAANVPTTNVTFKQTANIDMASAGAFAGIGTYAKIPTAGTPFLGTYDGQGFKISNVTRAAGNTVGIFNQVGPSGVIENLVVENMSFDGSLTGEYGCAIVGNAGGGATLRNLTAAGTFGSASKSSTHNMAGIVVRLSPGATAGAATTIDSCTNNATIYGGYTKLGGINAIVQNQTGFTDGKVVFVNCANNGTLVCKRTAQDVTGNAGIVGYIAGTNVELTGCYGNGVITNADGANADKDGALVGWTYGGTIKDNGGNAAPADKKMIGTWGSATETGFLYATVDAGVATTISGSIAAGGSYLLEGNAAPTIELAKDESIAFDTALGYTLTDTGITAAQGLEVNTSTSGTVTTFTAATPAGWTDETIPAGTSAATQYPALADTALATADADKLTTWAKAQSVDFADVKADSASYVDAFLLNCAATAEAVAAAKENFKLDITVNADGSVTVTAPDGYNVTPKIEGKQSLSDTEWHTKTDGDQFFRAVLSL